MKITIMPFLGINFLHKERKISSGDVDQLLLLCFWFKTTRSKSKT
jgi:hypothetical protein